MNLAVLFAGLLVGAGLQSIGPRELRLAARIELEVTAVASSTSEGIPPATAAKRMTGAPSNSACRTVPEYKTRLQARRMQRVDNAKKLLR